MRAVAPFPRSRRAHRLLATAAGLVLLAVASFILTGVALASATAGKNIAEPGGYFSVLGYNNPAGDITVESVTRTNGGSGGSPYKFVLFRDTGAQIGPWTFSGSSVHPVYHVYDGALTAYVDNTGPAGLNGYYVVYMGP